MTEALAVVDEVEAFGNQHEPTHLCQCFDDRPRHACQRADDGKLLAIDFPCDGTHPHFDVALDGVLGDAGDLLLPNTSLAAMRSVLEIQALPLVTNHHMVWLGGDHSVTLSLLRAYMRHLGRPQRQ